MISVPQGGGTVTFPSVTGSVSPVGSGSPGFNGPDGFFSAGQSTNINSLNGIAGIQCDACFFMAGVFETNTEPSDPAPAELNMTGDENFATLSPALNQVFFIGDGLTGTGSGSLQTFSIPEGATQLYLGFVDGWNGVDNFQGDPGWYGDNRGSLAVTYNIAPIPEPSTFALLGVGAVGLIGWVWRQRAV